MFLVGNDKKVVEVENAKFYVDENGKIAELLPCMFYVDENGKVAELLGGGISNLCYIKSGISTVVYRTDDNYETLIELCSIKNCTFQHMCFVDVDGAKYLVAIDSYGKGIRYSLDYGVTWTLVAISDVQSCAEGSIFQTDDGIIVLDLISKRNSNAANYDNYFYSSADLLTWTRATAAYQTNKYARKRGCLLKKMDVLANTTHDYDYDSYNGTYYTSADRIRYYYVSADGVLQYKGNVSMADIKEDGGSLTLGITSSNLACDDNNRLATFADFANSAAVNNVSVIYYADFSGDASITGTGGLSVNKTKIAQPISILKNAKDMGNHPLIAYVNGRWIYSCVLSKTLYVWYSANLTSWTLAFSKEYSSSESGHKDIITNGDTVYITCPDLACVLFSEDGGVTWTCIDHGISYMHGIAPINE